MSFGLKARLKLIMAKLRENKCESPFESKLGSRMMLYSQVYIGQNQKAIELTSRGTKPRSSSVGKELCSSRTLYLVRTFCS